MGVLDTLLLLAGSVIAIAVIGMVAYRGFSGRKTVPMAAVSMSSPITSVATETTGPLVAEPTPPAQISYEAPTPEPVQVQPIAAPEPIAIPVATAPSLEEAPPPFPEESNTNKTSIPTDVNAVSNITGPTEGASSVLVIATPKIKTPRAPRKRMPTSATPGTTTPRRRRSTKPKLGAPQVTVAAPTAPEANVPVEHNEQSA